MVYLLRCAIALCFFTSVRYFGRLIGKRFSINRFTRKSFPLLLLEKRFTMVRMLTCLERKRRNTNSNARKRSSLRFAKSLS